jgi:ATP-dependent Lon protease
MPDQNKSDWLDVPAEVRAKLKVHFVQHIADVLRLALEAK